ncbi:major capsid protein [Pelotomaculum propionicicum]|uniref:Major capsid protein n=1 Tax=Pelotomaculum propionicicum TaxID=258475 RepID=A0A4Y7RJI3_9FIRM|nr:major capsid protein [Pelotomaculum propionicicum]TEB09148.1 hypothetical protein Pmgp_03369 [Pelotomaculum propionicicum]
MPPLRQIRVVDPVLTTVVQGYKPPEFVGDKILPIVETDKMGGVIQKFGPDDFKLYNTRRATGAKSKRIQPREGDPVKLALHEESLEITIDVNERSEAPSQTQLEARRARVATNNIYTRKEKDQADAVLNPNNYAAGHVMDLSGTSMWSDYANSTPIDDVEDGKKIVRAKIGRRPNTILLGASTFDTLKQHPKLIERIQYAVKGVLTIELMKELFGINEILVGESLYADDKDALFDIWGDVAVLAYIPPAGERGEEVPSFGYTFRKKGHPRSAMYKEGNKLDVIEVWDIYDPMVLGPTAGFLIRNTN